MKTTLKEFLTSKELTSNQKIVAELVSKGLSNKEVANQMFIKEKTVKFHLTNLYSKLNVKNRAQLIIACLPYMNFISGFEV